MVKNERELICIGCGEVVKVNNYKCGHDEEYTCSVCRGIVYEKKRKKVVEIIEEGR